MKKNTLNYFDEFCKNIDFIKQASLVLNEYVNNFDYAKSIQMEEKVHSLENDADKNQHAVESYLIKDFLPPIDREDIITLLHRIDDMMDDVDDVFIKIDILDVETIRPDIRVFANLLLECSKKLEIMFENFKSSKNYDEVLKYVVEINDDEAKGDRIYQEAIRNLYKTETNAIELTKWTTIYNRLEDCFDSAEAVSETVRLIITKNS